LVSIEPMLKSLTADVRTVEEVGDTAKVPRLA
jgi:hypothetical protein